MLALTLSLIVIAVGFAVALSFHFLGLAYRPEEVARLGRKELEATRVILADLASPAHAYFARVDPTYTGEVVLFALGRLERDLKALMRQTRSRPLIPLFFLFRLYVAFFRLKTRFSASLDDVRRCIGFELFLLRRLQ